MIDRSVIGIDLGGTNIRAGLVQNKKLENIQSMRVDAAAGAEPVMQQLFGITDRLITGTVSAIGIGVPGLIDKDRNLVVDVINIPSWKQVPLKQRMEERYGLPVEVNNDANCFALGEYHFGKGGGSEAMIGLTIGTGLGTGIVLNGKLYAGRNCGAGEFGMIPYRDQVLEYYASGRFFERVYGIPGEKVFAAAEKGEAAALHMYAGLGTHLGHAVQIILYALDVDRIILGGSVRKAWPYFREALWTSLEGFAYQQSVRNLTIDVSELENSGILGAAALHYSSGGQAPGKRSGE